jgi:small subunit ribosomal protein S6
VSPYEILLMLDPELPEERQSEIVQRTRELVERGGGSVASHDVWGRRKLAYEIDHKTDGTYHLLTFSADAETLDEISRVLKITDGVMRHLAVRRSERRPGGTVAASAPARQDGAEPATVVHKEE